MLDHIQELPLVIFSSMGHSVLLFTQLMLTASCLPLRFSNSNLPVVLASFLTLPFPTTLFILALAFIMVGTQLVQTATTNDQARRHDAKFPFILNGILVS